MLTYAQSLERGGHLPKGSVDQLTKYLEMRFGDLTPFLQRTGQGSSAALNATFKFGGAIDNMTQFLQRVRAQMGLTLTDPNVTGKNYVDTFNQEMSQLKGIAANTTGAAHDAALQSMHDLRQKMGVTMDAMGADAQTKMALLGQAVKGKVQGAASSAAWNMWWFSDQVTKAVGSGALGAAKGSEMIRQALNAMLSALGEKPLPKVVIKGMTPGQVSSLSTTILQSTTGQGQGPGFTGPGGYGLHAAGGMVHKPMAIVGEEAPRHPEVVIATNPAYRSRNLGLFAQAGHMLGVPGFAQGGYLQNLWTGAGGPANVANVAAAIAMAESGGRNVMQQGQPWATTGWGLWQITPGNSSLLNPQLNAIAAVAKYRGAGNSFSPWTTFNDGAFRRFMGAQGAASAFTAPTIMAPQVTGGTATVRRITQAGLNKVAMAANAFIARNMPAMAGGPSGGPGTGGAAGPGGLGSYDGYRVANWIIPILNWARSHGWTGRVTSGYRSEPGSEHALVNWPGGAIDVGNSAAVAQGTNLYNVLRGYPGHPNLLWGGQYITGYTGPGGHDFGHFSGTGHKMGGVLFEHFQHGGIRGTRPRHVRYSVSHAGSSTGSALRAKTRAVAPKNKAKLPKMLRPVPGKFPLINRGLQDLSNLVGDRGTVAQLLDRYQATDALFQATHPNLQYVVTPTDGSAPHIDQEAVDASKAELMQLATWEFQIIGHYQAAVAYLGALHRRLANEITIRKNHIAAIKKRIINNLKRIKVLTDQIDRIRRSGTLDSRASLPFPTPKTGKAGASERAANRIFADQRKKRGWARNDAILYLNQTIKGIKDENQTLAGSSLTIGTGGNLATLNAQLTALTASQTSELQYHDDIVGVSGVGGSLNQAKITMIQLGQQLGALDSGALKTALGAAGPGAGAAAFQTQEIALLQQLASTSAAQKAVSDVALATFQGAQRLLPPFGGSFQTGGVVPGPVGAARTIIAHGGEYVSSTGGVQVQVIVHDGAVDPNKIEVIATNAAVQVTRNQARLGSRGLPGGAT
jgi:hypothetical protein